MPQISFSHENMGENRSSFCFFPSQVRKQERRTHKETRGVKISGSDTLKQRGKEYEGDNMEKDSSRLLILVLQNKVPPPLYGQYLVYVMKCFRFWQWFLPLRDAKVTLQSWIFGQSSKLDDDTRFTVCAPVSSCKSSAGSCERHINYTGYGNHGSAAAAALIFADSSALHL